MADTKIAWTEKVWNPVRGCSRVSAGCMHCYAERMATRFAGSGQPYEGLTIGSRWTGEVRFVPEMLDAPLHWRKPARVFVNSMSDLFHQKVTNEQIAAVFGVMAACQQHTFQVLTKRADRLALLNEDGFKSLVRDLLNAHLRKVGAYYRWPEDEIPGPPHLWPLSNVHLGVSAENQAAADERIPLLLQVPAAVRWVSIEPMLEAIDLAQWIERVDHCNDCGAENPPQGPDRCPECGQTGTLIATWGNEQAEQFRTGERYENDGPHECDDGPQLHWIVCGGESGPRARPMHPDWPRSIARQCKNAGVPVFFKQRGAWAARSWGVNATGGKRWGTLTASGEWYPSTTPWNGRTLDDSPEREEVMVNVGGHGGDLTDFPEDLRVREYPR